MQLNPLLLVSAGIPLLCAIIISFVRYGFGRVVGRRTVFLAGIISAALGGCLLWSGLLNPPQDATMILGPATLLAFFPNPIIDSLSLSWIVISALLTTVLLFWPSTSAIPNGAYFREALGGLLLLTLVQLLGLANHLWTQWGILSLSGWALCLVLARDISDGGRGRAAASTLVWFTIADFLWLIGLSTLSFVLPTNGISVMTNPDMLAGFTAGQVAISVSGLMFVLGGLVLRCGMYPLMSWTAPVALSFRDSAWLIGFGLGPALVLLFRWEGILTFFVETRLLVVGIGALSALLLSLMAWSDQRGPVRMAHLAAGQAAFVWMGVGAAPDQIMNFQALALAFVWLLPVFSLLCAQQGDAASSRLSTGSLWGLAVLLGVGILGQETVFEAIRTSAHLAGLNPWLLWGVALLAQFLLSLSLFRLIATDRRNTAHVQEGTLTVPRRVSTITVILVMLAVLGGLILIFLLPSQIGLAETPQVMSPTLSGVLILIALIIDRTWPNPASVSAPPDRWDALRRLARAEFYVPGCINVGVLLPTRAIAQLNRFFEWVVLGQLVQKIPAQMLRRIGDQAAQTDEEGTDAVRLTHLLTAVFVMLMGFIVGSWRGH